MISARPSQSTFVPTNDCTFSNKQAANGILGGLQIGDNFQSGKIVYGLETDFGLSSARSMVSGTYWGWICISGAARIAWLMLGSTCG
jgi:hypothetical protein